MSEQVPSLLTEDEKLQFEMFVAQTRRYLKGKSKNELVKICLSLLIDNYNLKAMINMHEQAGVKSE